jgi:hypothetical protein
MSYYGRCNPACPQWQHLDCAAVDDMFSAAAQRAIRICGTSQPCRPDAGGLPTFTDCWHSELVAAPRTAPQANLVHDYCALCGADIPDCERHIFDEPGPPDGDGASWPVIVYSDKIVGAIDQRCILDKRVCGEEFVWCTQSAVARVAAPERECSDP